jgi:uridine phosphorylase
VRDEGVSHHYAPPEVAAQPDAALTDALERSVVGAGLPSRRGSSWTIDSPYRDTAAEARHYQAQGVQCVEMEAAALFTVAAYRGAALASAFCISDSLADAEWNPLFDHPALAHNLLTLYGAAVDVAGHT